MNPFELPKREILIKVDSVTSPKFGKAPSERSIPELLDNGVVVIDKPDGPSSHQVSAYVQKILHIKKAGHSGTLDPAVTGVLPVALGKGTKIVQMLLPAGKEYVTVMHLHEDRQEAVVRDTITSLVGKITQLPPVRSAVKRQLRERSIYYVKILEIDGRDVLFTVGCEAGTYIRKLCHDIGVQLGCGAHMAQLRRTRAGPLTESELTSLQDLIDAYHYWKEKGDETGIRKRVIPIEQAIPHVPKIWVMDTTVDSLAHGAILHIPGIAKLESGIAAGNIVAVMTLKDELVCYGRAQMNSEEMMEKQRGTALTTLRVFMEPGVYPKVELPSKKKD